MTDATNPSAKTEPVLLPCPFCGGEASSTGVITYSDRHDAWWSDGSRVKTAYFVNCIQCGCDNKQMLGHQTPAEAITAWNTRTHPQPSLSVGLDREAVAKLVCREMGYDPDEHIKGGQATDFEDFGPRWKAARHGHWHGFTDYEDIADQIIKAILALAAPAEGYVLVPVEPTEAMIDAADTMGNRLAGSDIGTDDMTRYIWSAMIAACLPAAPVAPAEGWQPIETAPQRKKVIIHDPKWGVTEGLLFEDGKWGLATFNGQVMKANPTHWMPLPAAPTGETGV